MQDQQPRRLLSPVAIASLTTLVIATAGGAAWWTWKNQAVQPAPNPIENAQPQDPGAASQPSDRTPSDRTPATTLPLPAETALQVYWLTPTDTRIQLSPSAVKLTSITTPEAMLTAAMEELLAGPTQTSVATTIPAGTRLLDLSLKPDGIHVNLSREFTTGGGSTSMTGRLAQVLYTASSLDPNAKVWVSVEGKPLEALGGEGVVVEQPTTRQQFAKDFSL